MQTCSVHEMMPPSFCRHKMAQPNPQHQAQSARDALPSSWLAQKHDGATSASLLLPSQLMSWSPHGSPACSPFVCGQPLPGPPGYPGAAAGGRIAHGGRGARPIGGGCAGGACACMLAFSAPPYMLLSDGAAEPIIAGVVSGHTAGGKLLARGARVCRGAGGRGGRKGAAVKRGDACAFTDCSVHQEHIQRIQREPATGARLQQKG